MITPFSACCFGGLGRKRRLWLRSSVLVCSISTWVGGNIPYKENLWYAQALHTFFSRYGQVLQKVTTLENRWHSTLRPPGKVSKLGRTVRQMSIHMCAARMGHGLRPAASNSDNGAGRGCHETHFVFRGWAGC